MKKKNNYVNENISFEDFEQVISGRNGTPLDELVKERLSAEKEARQKERELKKSEKDKELA